MASEMEYYPNYAAQNLTRGDANIVGIVFPVTSRDAPANPFHIDLMRGASSALTPMHYECLLQSVQPKKNYYLVLNLW